jgi:hypothetical protein
MRGAGAVHRVEVELLGIERPTAGPEQGLTVRLL